MLKKTLRNQKGFTLIEIIAVLVILGILAAVAIPKYMDMQNTSRTKAAQGQIAEVKGRLSTFLAGYMLSNNGAKPATGTDLITFANNNTAGVCPTTATTEGDFEFMCAAVSTNIVTVTVSKVQDQTLSTAVVGTYTFK
jgi:MSHA pilin protein MshA